MSVSDPYEVLQVDPGADRAVIESAYRRLARKYHPDVSHEPDSHRKMIAINQAWEQLRDPVKRAAVDRARLRASGTTAWVAAADAHVRKAQAATPRDADPGGADGSADTPPRAANWPFGSMSDPADRSPQARADPGPRSWTTGRVPIGGFSSGAASRPDGAGSAGPPPGGPSGSVLSFGRFAGWSLGEIARTEIDYLEWLSRMPIGRIYQQEIDEILRAKGRRGGPADRKGRGPLDRR